MSTFASRPVSTQVSLVVPAVPLCVCEIAYDLEGDSCCHTVSPVIALAAHVGKSGRVWYRYLVNEDETGQPVEYDLPDSFNVVTVIKQTDELPLSSAEVRYLEEQAKSRALNSRSPLTGTQIPEPYLADWEKSLEQLGPMLAAHLRQAKRVILSESGGGITIEFGKEYQSTSEIVRDRSQDIRRTLHRVTGREWTVVVTEQCSSPHTAT